jgi:hypothetical protein
VENAIVKSILDDPSVQALIDEFVFEVIPLLLAVLMTGHAFSIAGPQLTLYHITSHPQNQQQQHHVKFGPMLGNWGGSIDPAKGLADSYKLFHDLRVGGMRAHSWV